MRTRPRQRCSIGEGEERRVLRYSTASWRMMFPCLSMQWKVPKKKRPSLIPTSILRKSSFLAQDIGPELLGLEPSELPACLRDDPCSRSMSISITLNWSQNPNPPINVHTIQFLLNLRTQILISPSFFNTIEVKVKGFKRQRERDKFLGFSELG
uniref:Uncharacterized protein LOC8262280 isoform X1 n=1 Tax=Rhizophora mucronata TaxID=61149 RepID=A0A2P2PSI4_RHIMU